MRPRLGWGAIRYGFGAHLLAGVDAAGKPPPANVFHPPVSRVCRTWMALASCPACQGQQRSLRRMRQVLSWALARSPGARSLAWAQLAAFCDSGLFLPLYGVITGSPAL